MPPEVLDFAIDYLPLQDCKLLYAISSEEIFLNAIKRILKNPMKYKFHFEYDRNFQHIYDSIQEYKNIINIEDYRNLIRLEFKIISDFNFKRWEHMSPLTAIAYYSNNYGLYVSELENSLNKIHYLNLTKSQIIITNYTQKYPLFRCESAAFISNENRADQIMRDSAYMSSYPNIYINYSDYLMHTTHYVDGVDGVGVINLERIPKIMPNYKDSHYDSYQESGSVNELLRIAVLNGNVSLVKNLLNDGVDDFILGHFNQLLLGADISYGLHIHHNHKEMVKLLSSDEFLGIGYAKDPKYLGITSEYYASIMTKIIYMYPEAYRHFEPEYELCPACKSDIKLMEEILSKMQEDDNPKLLPKLHIKNTAKNLVNHSTILRMDIMLYAVSKLDKSTAKEFVDEFIKGIEIGLFRDEYLEVIYDHDELSKYIVK